MWTVRRTCGVRCVQDVRAGDRYQITKRRRRLGQRVRGGVGVQLTWPPDNWRPQRKCKRCGWYTRRDEDTVAKRGRGAGIGKVHVYTMVGAIASPRRRRSTGMVPYSWASSGTSWEWRRLCCKRAWIVDAVGRTERCGMCIPEALERRVF